MHPHLHGTGAGCVGSSATLEAEDGPTNTLWLNKRVAVDLHCPATPRKEQINYEELRINDEELRIEVRI
jgi:hypothetical protein